MSMPKVYVGPKLLTVYDPAWLVSLFSNGSFQPMITTMKIDREGVVFYKLQVRDLNTSKVLDVQFVLPEELTSTVHLSVPSSEYSTESFEAVWDTQSEAADAFKSVINQSLEFWLKQIQTANSFDKVPEIKLLYSSCVLKWPWKNNSNEEYFRKFRIADQLHKFNLGIGYYNQEKNSCGVTLQLSLYPGKTASAIEASQASRKRRRTKEDGEETKGDDETKAEETVVVSIE